MKKLFLSIIICMITAIVGAQNVQLHYGLWVHRMFSCIMTSVAQFMTLRVQELRLLLQLKCSSLTDGVVHSSLWIWITQTRV